MLPTVPSTKVAPVGQVDPASAVVRVGDARQQAFQRVLAGLVGQSVRAEVLATLADGSALVKVAETTLRTQLPPGFPAGSALALTVLAAGPRPTFQLASGEAAVLHAALATPEDAALATAPAPARGAAAPLPAHAPRPDLPAALSTAGRMIAGILQAAHSEPGMAATVTGSAPLVGGAPPAPAQLAQQLHQVIAQSGLFYESHVAEWAEGKRPLSDLVREPQMQAARAAAEVGTARFIDMQLTSHEQGYVAWQGQLGRGQPLEWDIRKDQPGRGDDERAPQQQGWSSGLRLRFPLLGEVAASVTLRGGRVQLDVRAGSDEARALLRAHATLLAGALEAAGSPPFSLNIGSAPDPTHG